MAQDRQECKPFMDIIYNQKFIIGLLESVNCVDVVRAILVKECVCHQIKCWKYIILQSNILIIRTQWAVNVI